MRKLKNNKKNIIVFDVPFQVVQYSTFWLYNTILQEERKLFRSTYNGIKLFNVT